MRREEGRVVCGAGGPLSRRGKLRDGARDADQEVMDLIEKSVQHFDTGACTCIEPRMLLKL